MEIVTEPDLSSPREVKVFAKKLRQIVRYLEVSDADMEKGQMRFEANVSVRKEGEKLPDYRVEIKNLNSIKFLEKAVQFEIERQKKLLKEGKKLFQETRGWDEAKQRTYVQRRKEEACDYRYFPEPDIPPFVWNKQTLQKIKAMIPELPDEKKERFQKWFHLNEYEASILTEDKFLADWFEEALRAYVQTVWPGVEIGKGKPKEPVAISAFAKPLAHWTIGELLRKIKEEGKSIAEIPLSPSSLAELLYLVDKKKISLPQAKEVFEEMFKTKERSTVIVKRKGLGMLTDEGKIKRIILETVEENKKAVEDIKKGKKEAIGFLIGQVMAKTQGKVDPKLARKILLEELGVRH